MQKVCVAFCLLIRTFWDFLPNVPHASGGVRHVARRQRVRLLGRSPSEAACALPSNEVVPVLVCSGPVTIQSCAIGSKAHGTMSQQRSPDMSDKGR